MENVEWGSEIKVNAKIPDWLADDAVYEWRNHESQKWWNGIAPSKYEAVGGWDYIEAIRLPAEHPHYATPAPLDEAVQAAIALVDADLKAAVTELLSHRGENPYRILRGGMALWETWLPAFRASVRYLPSFPKTVDPLLIEAREIAASTPDEEYNTEDEDADIRAGGQDNGTLVRAVLAALRRGIELGKEGKC